MLLLFLLKKKKKKEQDLKIKAHAVMTTEKSFAEANLQIIVSFQFHSDLLHPK